MADVGKDQGGVESGMKGVVGPQKPLPAWITNGGFTLPKEGEGERPHQPTTVFVYGKPGAGKTTLISTFPKPFIIDTDHGLKTISNLGIQIPFFALDKNGKIYEMIIRLLGAIRAGKDGFEEGGKYGPIETIGFDSFSSLGEMLLRECVRERLNLRATDDVSKEKAQRDDYGLLRQRFWSILTELQACGKNVVATAWQMLEQDEDTGRMIGRPNIVGSIREVVGGYFDEYYYMNVRVGTAEGEKGKYFYETYTKTFQFWEARTRTSSLPAKLLDISYEKIVGGVGGGK